jgi:hypothetical protein
MNMKAGWIMVPEDAALPLDVIELPRHHAPYWVVHELGKSESARR